MKYVDKIEKNEEKKLILETWFSYGNEFVDDAMRKGKDRNRRISTKQLNPIKMNDVLKYLHEGKSISQIASLVGFSRKAIRQNIAKTKEQKTIIEVVKKGKCKTLYQRKITHYSLEKWIKNWSLNSYYKKQVWSHKIEEKFEYFIQWWNNNKYNKIIFPIKPSADYIIYQYCNGIKPKNVPTAQTIYKWAKENKYNFEQRFFMKLSEGKHQKKHKYKPKRRKYNDFSKDIKWLAIDLKGKSYENAYEIDLVKGKKTDKFAILTCLNKKTKMLYAIITRQDAFSVKLSLMKIMKKHNLKIDQLVIDNGSENVLLHNIKSIKQIYRCRPYCSSDKGQIENAHRLLRYWVKKGSSIDILTQEELDNAVMFVNNYPRRSYHPKKLMSAIEYAKWSANN